ncbi:MAG: hypothetical protein M1820_002492 [Bogoriella megaspora]|nr:MAG: hypothetical protein M1820_002492 [Bogoriella megaspora]
MEKRHPEVFTAQGDVDWSRRTRVVPMEVLSMGMPRTGTACKLAMHRALEILGYPCYHGLVLVANTADCVMWNQALDAKYVPGYGQFKTSDWDKLLGNYAAVADLPAILFTQELLEAYPSSKVVLVERDIETWYRSFNEGIIIPVWNPIIRFLAVVDTRFIGRLGSTSARWTKHWLRANSRQEMQNNAKSVYEEHYAFVRKITPPGRLLELKLGDGWEPLCKFLDKPIPDVPFPRVNESAALQEKMGLIVKRGIRTMAIKYSPWVMAIIGVGIIAWATSAKASFST